MLEIQKFIAEHRSNWRELLTSPPYSLIIKKKDNLYLFQYMQGVSDYALPIVLEARGLILEDETFNVVCMGFTKFFLCDSAFASKINWNNIKVEEKYDGTLITLYYYNNKWNKATTGTIDAYDAPISGGHIRTFGELFDVASKRCELDYSKLNTDYCYMFELISPFNQVVVKYDDIEIVHIGTRDRLSLKELDTDIGIRQPERYDIKNLDDALSAVNTINYDGEGFVVVDNEYNRIKVKSDKWFKLHYEVNNNKINLERGLEILLSDDMDEFVAQFPHYAEYFNNIKKAYDEYVKIVNYIIAIGKRASKNCASRREYAEYFDNFLNVYIVPDDKKYYSMFKNAYFGVFENNDYTYRNYFNDAKHSHIVKVFETTYNRLFKD